MSARPYWSGQIRISLVSFPVSLVSALRRSAQIPLHEVDRESGSRVHHRNVTEDGTEVPRENIVKSYTSDKGDVLIEASEIDAIKLPSSDTLELDRFVDARAIPIARFERPYFLLPDGKDAAEIYRVIFEALKSSGKAGIGQITMRGREELCGVLAQGEGLMLFTLRYDAELNDGGDFYPDLGSKKLKSDYVDLAHQLIDKNEGDMNFSAYHDHYHEALLELIHAKQAHRKPKPVVAAKKAAKVVDFMDALRKSLGREGRKRAPSPVRSTVKKRRRA